jgi:hypothetical protein
MRPIAEGFLIEAGPGQALALDTPSASAAAEADASHFTRRFDFPPLPTDALFRRMQAAVVTAASAPKQARVDKRTAVAEATLALGLGAEAQSILTLAATEDARAATDPGQMGLTAIAAMLADRPAEAAGIEDPRLSGTDEITLWRAVRTAMLQAGAPEAAPAFAATLPLLLAYPAALRDRLLPLAAETMIAGGEPDAARRLLDRRRDDHNLDLARALLLDQDARRPGGDPALALTAYAKVVESPDRLAHARAAVLAVELRLAAGQLMPAQAADALDTLIYAWRGDEREFALRLRVAELRQQASAWRASLALLRETETLWPEQCQLLRARMGNVFTAAIGDDAHNPLPPIDLVALADENADLIPDGEAGQVLASRLADRLAALDLPKRAIPVLEKLAANAAPGPVRAEFGGRLAAMRLAQGDAAGALAALTRSAADSLPPALLESRALTFARAAAAIGDLPSADAALAALDTLPAETLRADLLEAAQDWPAAESALRNLVRRTVPPDGPLTEPQARTLLRLASAAAQTGDDATLTTLREHDISRLPEGKLADLFRLLTEVPVRGVADLPRAAKEVKLARDVSAALNTLTR